MKSAMMGLFHDLAEAWTGDFDFVAKHYTEAKCAKDADSLEQLYQEWVLSWEGNRLAQKWFEGDYKDRVPGLRTESAKKIAHKIKDGHPQEWWWSRLTKNERAIDKEKLLGKK